MAKRIKQAPLTTAKMFTASWTEKDEAILVELLKRKIHELRYEISEATSPYVKGKLRKKRSEYKVLLAKVEVGEYDPNILANELRTHSQFRDREVTKKTKKLGRYADAYTDMDFDYEAYFNRTRYFGMSLPIIMLILILVFSAILLSPFFMPQQHIDPTEKVLSDGLKSRVSFSSVAYFKLGYDESDFSMVNNGAWPKGTYRYPDQALEKDQLFVDGVTGVPPERVFLYEDVGMTSIDITIADIIKTLFKTELFSESRVDPIEDLDQLQGPSWFYIKYIQDRKEDLKLKKLEDGTYDTVALVRAIATYGTMASLILMLLLCMVELILNVGRLFSYTSRRIHFIPFFILILGLLTMLLPAFMEISAINNAAALEAIRDYFQPNWDVFIENPTSTITFNLMFPLLLVLPTLTAMLPLFFKNKQAKTIAYVPKGNRPHTYYGHDRPTRPGQPGARRVGPQANAQRIAKAGSKSAFDPRYPTR